jgi:hypothetical protein
MAVYWTVGESISVARICTGFLDLHAGNPLDAFGEPGQRDRPQIRWRGVLIHPRRISRRQRRAYR